MSQTTSKPILIIQTAFIGDTILASHFARAVKEQFPESPIHFFLRKGNESVIQGLSSVDRVWVWEKQGGKTRNLMKLIGEMRKYDYHAVFNLHRHFNSGLVTLMMKASHKIGFKQNPLSFFYTNKVNHQIPHYIDQKVPATFWHEVQRNLELLKILRPNLQISHDSKKYKPELPIQQKHLDKIAEYEKVENYFVMAPASVWFTKAWSEHKYRELTERLATMGVVYLIGGPGDFDLCERIRKDIPHTVNLCGKLGLLDSAALMKKARRVFVNDSAPLHLASAVNAKTTAIFCSTVKEFGYFTLADDSVIIETPEKLSCRPCGLHGHKECPQMHFNCAEKIQIETVVNTIS